jgi:hypothetical protein
MMEAEPAIVFPLRAAARSSHFERFARRNGGWSAQSSSLWASIRANFLIREHAMRSRAFPRSPRSKARVPGGSFPELTRQLLTARGEEAELQLRLVKLERQLGLGSARPVRRFQREEP